MPRGLGAPLPPRGVRCAGCWGRPEFAQSPMGAWHRHHGSCGVAQSGCCPAVRYSSQEIWGEGLIWVLSAQGGGTWHCTVLGSEIAADIQFITAAATQGNCCRNPLAPQGEWGRGLHGLWVARRGQGHHWHPEGGKGGKPPAWAPSCPLGSALMPSRCRWCSVCQPALGRRDAPGNRLR